jgi:hypothetical protein
VDGRATARHLHGRTAHTVRCATVEVSADSAGAVASNVFLESLTTRQKCQVGTTIVDHSVKVGASLTPSLTPLPLTSPSPQRW